jgi:hypothetical protein
MFIPKSTLFVGLLLVTPLFGMGTDTVLRRVRGKSTAIELTLTTLLDSPVGSQPDTPSPLEPTEIGAFGDEDADIKEFTDNDDDQNIIYTPITEKKALTPKKNSEADLSPNWRNDPRSQPGFEHTFRPTSPRKKSSYRPTNSSTNCRNSNQPLAIIHKQKPRRNDIIPNQLALAKKGYDVWTPTPSTKDQQLAVVATAATLCSRTHKSTNFFDILPEVKS